MNSTARSQHRQRKLRGECFPEWYGRAVRSTARQLTSFGFRPSWTPVPTGADGDAQLPRGVVYLIRAETLRSLSEP